MKKLLIILLIVLAITIGAYKVYKKIDPGYSYRITNIIITHKREKNE